MPSEKKRDYEVGYGKPPRHTRYSKGQSGNPKGRQRGARNLSTLLAEALNEHVVITENGERRKISKRQAFVKQLVNRALKGDPRSEKHLLDLLQKIESRTEPETSESWFGAADKKVIEQLKKRLRGKE
jgi:Family of unknown function (DUF5681)